MSVKTLPANFVTTTSATFHGFINTGGQGTSWLFQYGTKPYTASTPFETIPPGPPPMNYEAATIFQLKPNTTYHFQLVAYSGIGTSYQEKQTGGDLTFTTKPTGRLLLLRSRLRVARGLARVPLRCQSRFACRGRLSIKTLDPAGGGGAGGATLVCASRSLTMRGGRTRTFTPKLRPACRSLLHRRSNHVLRAQFTSRTRTGQRGVNRAIKLSG